MRISSSGPSRRAHPSKLSLHNSMILSRGLSAFWNFDEADGGPYTDALGKGLDFDEFSTIGKDEGRPGTGITAVRSVSGNARLDYADFTGNESVLLTTQDFSVSFWFYLPGAVISQYWLLNTNGIVTSNPGIMIRVNTSEQIIISFRDDTTLVEATLTDVALTEGAWNHVVGVFDRDGNVEFFIDKVSAGTMAISTAQNSIDDSGQAWRVGSGNSNFTGTFDSLGVWNRLLSSRERSILYNSGWGLAYPFNDAAAQRITFNIPTAVTFDVLWHRLTGEQAYNAIVSNAKLSAAGISDVTLPKRSGEAFSYLKPDGVLCYVDTALRRGTWVNSVDHWGGSGADKRIWYGDWYNGNTDARTVRDELQVIYEADELAFLQAFLTDIEIESLLWTTPRSSSGGAKVSLMLTGRASSQFVFTNLGRYQERTDDAPDWSASPAFDPPSAETFKTYLDTYPHLIIGGSGFAAGQAFDTVNNSVNKAIHPYYDGDYEDPGQQHATFWMDIWDAAHGSNLSGPWHAFADALNTEGADVQYMLFDMENDSSVAHWFLGDNPGQSGSGTMPGALGYDKTISVIESDGASGCKITIGDNRATNIDSKTALGTQAEHTFTFENVTGTTALNGTHKIEYRSTTQFDVPSIAFDSDGTGTCYPTFGPVRNVKWPIVGDYDLTEVFDEDADLKTLDYKTSQDLGWQISSQTNSARAQHGDERRAMFSGITKEYVRVMHAKLMERYLVHWPNVVAFNSRAFLGAYQIHPTAHTDQSVFETYALPVADTAVVKYYGGAPANSQYIFYNRKSKLTEEVSDTGQSWGTPYTGTDANGWNNTIQWMANIRSSDAATTLRKVSFTHSNNDVAGFGGSDGRWQGQKFWQWYARLAIMTGYNQMVWWDSNDSPTVAEEAYMEAAYANGDTRLGGTDHDGLIGYPISAWDVGHLHMQVDSAGSFLNAVLVRPDKFPSEGDSILVVDGSDDTKVTSASYTFVAADVGSTLRITTTGGGAAWTIAYYSIISVTGGAAILQSSPAIVSSTAGVWTMVSYKASGTDLDSDADAQVHSTVYTFVANDVGKSINVTAGTGFTVAWYKISSVAAGVATLDADVGTHPITGGTWSMTPFGESGSNVEVAYDGAVQLTIPNATITEDSTTDSLMGHGAWIAQTDLQA